MNIYFTNTTYIATHLCRYVFCRRDCFNFIFPLSVMRVAVTTLVCTFHRCEQQ